MENSFWAEVIIYVFAGALIVGIIYAATKGFKGGNSVTVFGATAELYTKDKRNAMETITEQKAKKKLEEDETGEPE